MLPSREASGPVLGTAWSLDGNGLIPAWEKTRSQAGNNLFPGREISRSGNGGRTIGAGAVQPPAPSPRPGPPAHRRPKRFAIPGT